MRLELFPSSEAAGAGREELKGHQINALYPRRYKADPFVTGARVLSWSGRIPSKCDIFLPSKLVIFILMLLTPFPLHLPLLIPPGPNQLDGSLERLQGNLGAAISQCKVEALAFSGSAEGNWEF